MPQYFRYADDDDAPQEHHLDRRPTTYKSYVERVRDSRRADEAHSDLVCVRLLENAFSRYEAKYRELRTACARMKSIARKYDASGSRLVCGKNLEREYDAMRSLRDKALKDAKMCRYALDEIESMIESHSIR